MNKPQGEVFDIGYQPYEGAREGRNAARKALLIDGMRTALGMGRGLTAKILPGLLFLALLIPALVFIIIASVVGQTGIDDLPGVADYYQGAIYPVLIFSAIIAPELLTTDRRNGVLSLYLVRPITSSDYIIGRWLAFFLLSLIVVWVPQLLLYIGVNLGSTDAWEYLRDNWDDIPRFLLAGAALALFTTTLPLAAAAFTDRRAIAAALVIGIWVIALAVGNALSDGIGGTAGAWLALIDIGSTPLHINDMIFNQASDGPGRAAEEVPKAVRIGWYLILVAVPAAFLYMKYRKVSA
jgi:ABC-2 type transport system permease protein